ncbi:MAG: metallophosphoesterase, partial [Clostridia bacterium]|nr:metallophosphoesterase [Clostridia bacterium]
MNRVERLTFRADNHFKILMVSDFHMGKNPTFAENLNYRVTEGLEALLSETEPDFVMLGGDQCIEAASIPQAAELLSEVINPVLIRGLPWAAVFGNHDNEVGLPVREEEEAYLRIPGCMNVIHPDPSFGAGNFCLKLYSHDGDRLLYDIFALDSHREITDFIDLFDLGKDTSLILPEHFNEGATGAAPTFEQAMWYYNTSARIEADEGRKIPAVMFMHIPLPEFLQVTRNPEEC